ERKRDDGEEAMEHPHKIGGPPSQQRIAEEVAKIWTKAVVNAQPERLSEPANPELHLAGMDPTIRIDGPRTRMRGKMHQPRQHWQRPEYTSQQPPSPRDPSAPPHPSLSLPGGEGRVRGTIKQECP